MAGSDVTFSRGMPVEIGQIQRELKKLWEEDAGGSTRASLMNLAVYCEGEAALTENTDLISAFTRDHACRAIVVAVEPDSPNNRAQAWISAHCHMSRAGAKQVCCEQISFLLEGSVKGVFPNILFSNLDSDLPLYLWWQARLDRPIDEQLLTWVDRFIFDSASWSEWKKPFALLREFPARSRLTVRDLNWARTLYLRQTLAQLYDNPENLPHLDCVQGWKMTCAPGFRSSAYLLAGWLAAQLKWKLVDAANLLYETVSGETIRGKIEEKEGAAVSRCEIACKTAVFSFSRDPHSDFFHADYTLPDGERHYLLRAGKEETIDLLDQELMMGAKHTVYLKALTAALPLFTK